MALSNKVFVGLLVSSVSEYSNTLCNIKKEFTDGLLNLDGGWDKIDELTETLFRCRTIYRNMSFYLSRVSKEDKVKIEEQFDIISSLLDEFRNVQRDYYARIE